MKLTDKQIREMAGQASLYIESRAEGETIADTLAQVYLDAFPEHTREQAKETAAKVLEGVDQFGFAYKEAVHDIDGFIGKFQKRVERGKTLEEKCCFWLRFSAAVSAANAQLADGKDRSHRVEAIEQMCLPPDRISEQMLISLRLEAKQAIKASSVMLVSLSDHIDMMKGTADSAEAARLLLSINNDERELRAAGAMLCYIQCQRAGEENGQMVPVEQAVCQFCADHERIQIETALGENSITEQVASFLAMILGSVLIFFLTLWILNAGLELAFALFSGILLIPAYAVLHATALWLLYEAVLGEHGWLESCDGIVKAAFVSLRKLRRGAQRMASGAKNRLPQLAGDADGIWNRIVSFIRRKAMQMTHLTKRVRAYN